MKLWDKGFKTDKIVEEFTVGKDRELDIFLAKYDVQGTLAHIKMLESINLLEKEELNKLSEELIRIYVEIEDGNFEIEDGIEDVHSQVEVMLTKRLGEIGKKVHSGRSRNDQVLVDLKLFIRAEIQSLAENTNSLFTLLQELSDKYKDILIPGYTHLQVAMPSSFGLWFGAYAESLIDDIYVLNSAYKVANQNPLGSAAGYGSSFPLNRTMTTNLLGFEELSYNVVYAQMGRGKTEKIVAFALSSIASTLNKMAVDSCLFMSQNFGFISFPNNLTTGSSIMPHKKNPDVFELIRAKTNKLSALANEIAMLTANMTSGYHRDMQLLKESFIPAFKDINDCILLMSIMMDNVKVNENILDDPKYDYLFSVEEVNNAVLSGIPFRDAYKKIGLEIEAGNFTPNKSVNHTHEGSIGNLCNSEIKNKMDKAMAAFKFEAANAAINTLLQR